MNKNINKEILIEATEREIENQLESNEPDYDFIMNAIDLIADLNDERAFDENIAEENMEKLLNKMLGKRKIKVRLSFIAACFAIVIISVICSVFVLGNKIQKSPEPNPDHAVVNELITDLGNHGFKDVKISDIFKQTGWTVTEPYYYEKEGIKCAAFAFKKNEQTYCFTIKCTDEVCEDFTDFGLGKIRKIENNTTIYIFEDGADLSEMRFNCDNLAYEITSNIPSSDMIKTAKLFDLT